MAPKKGNQASDYLRLASEGYSKTETARMLGVSVATVFIMARRYNINFPAGYVKKEKRDAQLVQAQ